MNKVYLTIFLLAVGSFTVAPASADPFTLDGCAAPPFSAIEAHHNIDNSCGIEGVPESPDIGKEY